MLPDRVSNPGPLTYESGALPIALSGPAYKGRNNHGYIPIHLNDIEFLMEFNILLVCRGVILDIFSTCIPTLN